MDLLVLIFLSLLSVVRPHGRLVDPISRASLWRYGYDTPINYNDNELFCGGFQNLWETHQGKCGVCGDPWQGPKEHEAGGKYASRIISRMYEQGSVVTMVVDLTSNHLGYFEFRLCPNNNFSQSVTQSCLDKYLLRGMPSGIGRHMVLKDFKGKVEYQIQLPPTVTCSQCIIQWKYHAGNSWGKDAGGRSCKGCGPQEEFYNCADVSILPPDRFHALLQAKKSQLPNGRKHQRTFVGTEKPKEIVSSTKDSSLKPESGIADRTRQFRNPFATGVSIPKRGRHDVTLSELVRNVQTTGVLDEQGWFQYPMADNTNPREPSPKWGLNLVSRLTDNSYYPKSFNFATENIGTLPTWNAYTVASLPLNENYRLLHNKLRNLWSDRFMTDIPPIVQNHGISFDSIFLRPDISEVASPTVMNSYNTHGFQTMDILPSRSLPTELSPRMDPVQHAEYGELMLGGEYPVWNPAPYQRAMPIRRDILPLTDYQRLMEQWVNY